MRRTGSLGFAREGSEPNRAKPLGVADHERKSTEHLGPIASTPV